MLDAGMSTEHVARHVGCSSRAIQNLRIRFRTRSTNDMPRRGRPRVTTHDNATSHTARDTVNFLRTNNSPDLNLIEHVWDSLDRRLRRRPDPPATSTNFVKPSFRKNEQYSTGRIQHFSQFYVPAMHCSGQFKRWSYPLLSVWFFF